MSMTAPVELRPETETTLDELVATMERMAPFPYSDANQNYPNLVSGLEDVFEIQEPEVEAGRPTLFLLIGPSGVGQDTLLDAMTDKGFSYARLRTATTREIREGEEPDAYVWMEKGRGSTNEEIIGDLEVRYGLLECQNHCGSYYGLPISSVEEAAADNPELPIIAKNECAGAEEITRNADGRLNVVTLALMPESYRQLFDRIQHRGNTMSRMLDSFRYAVESRRVANYAIRNRERESAKAGVDATASQMIELINDVQRAGASYES
jgi:guanylate kinase